MVDRSRRQVEDILYSKMLSCYPFEEYAAKEYINYLKWHPEESPDTVHMRIDSYEREEDHYGNGGGYDRYVRIYKTREETDAEYKNRVSEEEKKEIDIYFRTIEFETNEVLRRLNLSNCDKDKARWLTWDMMEKANKKISEKRNEYI